MNLEFIICTETKLRFLWEIAVQLNNARELGISHLFTYLMFTPKGREAHPNCKFIEKTFPEAKFVYYEDDHDIWLDIQHINYPPLNRLYTLRRYFKTRENKPFFYIDSDVLFLNTKFIIPLLEDDVNYLSNTAHYLNHEYFDSKGKKEDDPENENYGKPKFVREDLFTEYKRRDVLKECAEAVGITKELVVNNKDRCGGAQYLLKNIDGNFWGRAYMDTMAIRQFLRKINQQYMRGDTPLERENNGFQSWCADMFGVLWGLYRLDKKIETPKSLDFAWATDEIDDRKFNIFHNAGAISDGKIRTTKKDEYGNSTIIESPCFYKGKYANDTLTPFEDTDYLKSIIEHPISQTYWTSYYTKEILKTKTNLKL
jgi:hypothetical protein